MEVIYWQIAVAGSTAAAYLFRSRNWAIGVAILWSIWTFFALSYGPLVILQLVSAWGAFLLIDAFTRQRRELDKFKKALDGFRQQEKDALVEARKEGRYTLLSDSSHYDYMIDQIEQAQSSVMILSGWVSDKVIDAKFVRAVSNALHRGVKVYIGFGFENSQGVHEISRPAKRALVALEKMTLDYQGIAVGRFNNHQKALVVDKQRVVCGSHNWLSNRAFKNREQSFVIEDREAASAVFNHSAPLITGNQAFAPA